MVDWILIILDAGRHAKFVNLGSFSLSKDHGENFKWSLKVGEIREEDADKSSLFGPT